MKLRYLASILGALCSLLHAHAQPLPARQTTLPGTYRISAGTQLSYETPLAPLAAELFEHFLGITPQPGRLRFNFDYRKFTEDELIMQGESTWKNEGGVP